MDWTSEGLTKGPRNHVRIKILKDLLKHQLGGYDLDKQDTDKPMYNNKHIYKATYISKSMHKDPSMGGYLQGLCTNKVDGSEGMQVPWDTSLKRDECDGDVDGGGSQWMLHHGKVDARIER